MPEAPFNRSPRAVFSYTAKLRTRQEQKKKEPPPGLPPLITTVVNLAIYSVAGNFPVGASGFSGVGDESSGGSDDGTGGETVVVVGFTVDDGEGTLEVVEDSGRDELVSGAVVDDPGIVLDAGGSVVEDVVDVDDVVGCSVVDVDASVVVVGCSVVDVVTSVVVVGSVQSPLPVSVWCTPLLQTPKTVNVVPKCGTVVDPPIPIDPECPWSVVNVIVLSDSEFTINQTPGDWQVTVV